MIYLLAGICALFIGHRIAQAISRANPPPFKQMLRRASGIASLLLGLGLIIRGRFAVALGFGGLGAWLLGLGSKQVLGGFSAGPAFAGRGPKFGGPGLGGVSRVRSAMIEMELDHETGAMAGTVLAGTFEGRRLDSLSQGECEALYKQCLGGDSDGARLLEAYLDRRFSRWRQTREGNSHSRERADSRPGAMSEQEAYDILGLQEGAAREEIVRSHRTLMKKLHPDLGGTTDLAARVNEAKDVLMRRHQ